MNQKEPIGVAGLGLMGSSIATCLLLAGHPVTGLVKKPADGAAAEKRIRKFLDQLKEDGLLSPAASKAASQLNITGEIKLLTGRQLVIESITEDTGQKKKLFRELETALSPTAIIGTNTSAIPVSILQEDMQHPERLIGIHWGEPAHVGRFMEVICGRRSDVKYAEKIMTLAEGWGKEPSLVRKDIRGFISNRLMYALMREAFSLVKEGYATYEDIDRACRNDLGSWITFAGPFRYMDITGIPAYLTVMQELFPELDNAQAPPDFIRSLVASGAKGIANARGFYNYSGESAEKWERRFVEFSHEIRDLSLKYPQNTGDI